MKKLSKVLALALTLVMIIGATLMTGVVTTSADDITVWEGTIDMDFTTKNTVAIINVDDSLTQAIRDDLAANGAATQYTITSPDSSFISGPSGYVVFGFYQETPIEEYLEVWADKGSSLNNATFTDTAALSKMNLKTNFCLFSDGTGDVAHIGSIKIVATHAAGATPITTKPIQPSVNPGDLVKSVLWTGTIDADFVTASTMAFFKIDELNQAIRDDIAANGPAAAYVVEADGQYVSGESGYASYLFYQETPAYLEAWADKGSTVNLAVWSNAAELAQMGDKVQIGLACDTSGDTIHIGTLTLYVSRDGSIPQPSQTVPSQTVPSQTVPSQTVPSQTVPSQTVPSQTVPSQVATPGDSNGDGSVNMKDVLLLRKLLAELPADGINMTNADVNGDGNVNMKDVLALRKMLAGM